MKLTPRHSLISAPVTDADLPRVIKDANEMSDIIHTGRPCVALAHSQVDDKNPLAFYVTREGDIIINPEIISHGRQIDEGPEGCMTFPDSEYIMKSRYRIVTVRYQKIKGDTLSKEKSEMTLRGFEAVRAQHEIDHLNGIYCYDKV